MNTDKKENRILLKNTLFDIIVNHSYQGKVPPERVLSELLGVNRFTLRKSMDELISEGKLYRKPRKGTYILQLHTKVVGLVVDMGKIHPYGNMMSVISGVCRELERANCMVRFINPRDMKELSGLIRQYDLDACILGYSDHPDAEKILSFIPEEIRHKIIFVSSWAYWMKKQEIYRNYVEMASIGAMRVKYLARAGGRKLCIITQKANPSLDDIKAKLEELGLPFYEEFILDDKKNFKTKLSKLLRKKMIDSILIDGFYRGIFDDFMEILQNEPEFTGPVSMPYVREVRYSMERYPDTNAKIIYNFQMTEKLGEEAAKMAVGIVKSGTWQTPVFVEGTFLDNKEQR